MGGSLKTKCALMLEYLGLYLPAQSQIYIGCIDCHMLIK